MALAHEFCIIENLDDVINIDNQVDLKKVYQYRHIAVDDAIIIYMSNTLKWFISTNTAKTKTTKGLFYYGISLIESDNLNTFLKIVGVWKELFNLAPEVNIIPEFNFDKKYILHKIEELIKLLEYASTNDKIILHCGI